MYTALSGGYAGIRAIIEIALCYGETYECNTFHDIPTKCFGFVGIASCLMFFFFTIAMFIDQVNMKIEDTSTIDSMKNKGLERKNKNKKSFAESLGGWTPWWFIPVPVGNDFSPESQLNHTYY